MVAFFYNLSLQIFHRGFIIHVFRHFIKSKLFLTDYIIFDFKNPLKSKAQWYLYRWHQNYQPYLVEPRGIDLHFLPTGKKIIIRLGRALAGGAHPRRIKISNPFHHAKSTTYKVVLFAWQQLIIMIRFHRVSKGFT